MSDLNALLPAEVLVTFPRSVQQWSDETLVSYHVFLVSLNLAELPGVVGFPGQKVLHCTALAVSDGSGTGTPANDADLQALAQQIATDYYRQALARLDIQFAGLIPWQPEGLSQSIEWTHEAAQLSTRIQRGAWNVSAAPLLQQGHDVPTAGIWALVTDQPAATVPLYTCAQVVDNALGSASIPLPGGQTVTAREMTGNPHVPLGSSVWLQPGEASNGTLWRFYYNPPLLVETDDGAVQVPYTSILAFDSTAFTLSQPQPGEALVGLKPGGGGAGAVQITDTDPTWIAASGVLVVNETTGVLWISLGGGSWLGWCSCDSLPRSGFGSAISGSSAGGGSVMTACSGSPVPVNLFASFGGSLAAEAMLPITYDNIRSQWSGSRVDHTACGNGSTFTINFACDAAAGGFIVTGGWPAAGSITGSHYAPSSTNPFVWSDPGATVLGGSCPGTARVTITSQ